MPVEEKGASNPLLDEALNIGEQSAVDTQPQNTNGDRPAPVLDPNPGTFEAFMGSFGTPQRWAGRS